MPDPSWTWGIWLTLVVGTFAGLEAWALATRATHGDTLSEFLRRILGVRPRRRWRYLPAAGFVLFLGWLAVHIVLEI